MFLRTCHNLHSQTEWQFMIEVLGGFEKASHENVYNDTGHAFLIQIIGQVVIHTVLGLLIHF